MRLRRQHVAKQSLPADQTYRLPLQSDLIAFIKFYLTLSMAFCSLASCHQGCVCASLIHGLHRATRRQRRILPPGDTIGCQEHEVAIKFLVTVSLILLRCWSHHFHRHVSYQKSAMRIAIFSCQEHQSCELRSRHIDDVETAKLLN